LTNFTEVNSSPTEIDTVLLLENIMLQEKFFLLPKFDLIMKSLAQSSYLSVDKCSRSINQTQGLNIPDWVNKYRVDYFIQIFPEKSRINTIDAIALESGFSSKSTFYRAFKKEKGMTPSDYFNKN
jgi:AraC-like DNA-binding protein